MLKRVNTERNTVRNYKDEFIVQVKLLSVAYEYFTVIFPITVYAPVFVLEFLFFISFFLLRFPRGQWVKMPWVETVQSSLRYTHCFSSVCVTLILCRLDLPTLVLCSLTVHQGSFAISQLQFSLKIHNSACRIFRCQYFF